MWLAKLMGYDYKITYKMGAKNIASDAIFRVLSSKLLAISLSAIYTELMGIIKISWSVDEECKKLIVQHDQGLRPSRFSCEKGVLKRKRKIVVGRDEELHENIVLLFHASALGKFQTHQHLAKDCVNAILEGFEEIHKKIHAEL